MLNGSNKSVFHLSLAAALSWVSVQLPPPEDPALKPAPIVVVVPNSPGRGALVPVETVEGETRSAPQAPPPAQAPARQESRGLVGSELKGRLRVEGKNPKVYELRETTSGENVITEW